MSKSPTPGIFTAEQEKWLSWHWFDGTPMDKMATESRLCLGELSHHRSLLGLRDRDHKGAQMQTTTPNPFNFKDPVKKE